MSVFYSLGLDPGWKNAGISIVECNPEGLHLLRSATVNPSSFKDFDRCKSTFDKILDGVDKKLVVNFGIERYVTYRGVQTSESENILMYIGGMRERALTEIGTGCNINLYRAIDWKIALVKQLVKLRAFNNPSESLDKKFSIAAAHACLDSPGNFKTDHEADSICIASLPFLRPIQNSRSGTGPV